MTTMTPARPCVTGGVDTHRDEHVAAALDGVGGLLGTKGFPTTTAGYTALLAWLRSHGEVGSVGVEGTGSYGAALARHLSSKGVLVLEVSRPNRQVRRRYGKSDVVDAMVRMSTDQTTRDYIARRQSEGKTKIEAMRCLKRYVPEKSSTHYQQQPTVDSRSITSHRLAAVPCSTA